MLDMSSGEFQLEIGKKGTQAQMMMETNFIMLNQAYMEI